MRLILHGLLLLAFTGVAWGGPDQASVAATVRERLAADARGNPAATGAEPGSRPAAPRNVTQDLATQRPDGSWADIPYDNRDRSLWPPVEHLHRLRAIAAAGRAPGAVARGLAFWVQRDPQSDNWWWNTIGMQQALGPLLVLARDDLRAHAPAVWDAACRQMGRSHVDKMTGTNLVWEAGNLVTLAALTDNEPLLARMLALIKAEITVTTLEGVQPDFSFHQHGPQLNAGNYGLSFVPTAAKFALLVRGTPLAFPPEKLGILAGFEANFQEWVVWGNACDLSSCGRQLDQPHAQLGKARSIAAAGRLLGELDPASAPHWTCFLDRVDGRCTPEEGAPTGDRYYWRSDFLVHRPGHCYFSVKMFSPRVLRTETQVNSENFRGYHLCDGMTQLMVRGDEYADIQPVWDWRMLPGITFKRTTAPLPYGHDAATEHNPRPFVGGAQTEGASVAAMELAKEDVSANKAWFCFPSGIVCLGTALHCAGPEPLYTVVNQCLQHGGVEQRGDRTLVHDNVAYVLLEPAHWSYTAGPQTGAWSLLRKEGVSDAPVTRDVFKLWIDHGTRPAHATYAYAILSLATPQQVRAATRSTFRVLANGDAQIVADVPDGIVGAVFHRPGRSPAAFGLPEFSVDHACVVIARRDRASGRVSYAVADPTQQLARITLTPQGESARRFTLPGGGMAGSTVARSD